MRRKKILFITPPYHCGVVEVAGRWIPLTFVYLAGAARDAGFEPVIHDAMTLRETHEDIVKKIEEVRPDIVATTAITSTTPDALQILKNTKKINPSIITIIGGVHPTFMFEEVLKSGVVDYVVRGEGEATLKELLLSLAHGEDTSDLRGIAIKRGEYTISAPPRQFIADLDGLPAAWDLLEWREYRYFVVPGSRLGAISTSRGCNHDCTFCSQQKFWHQSWRARSPEGIVKEMENLNSRYGVDVFLITDEYPTKDRLRWERLLDLLIENDMGVKILMETRAEDILRDRDILHKYRKAGIIHVYIGVEATDQETLDLIKKDIGVETGLEALRLIHEHDMISETSFILGFPDETPQSVKRTLELSRIYNPDFAHYLALAPWPYADMYRELKPYVKVKDYRKYNLIDPVIEPENMSLKDIDRAIIDCYQSFYMGKLRELAMMRDGFKKRYLLHSMRLIMNSSFIVDKLGSAGKIPPQVEALMRKLQPEPVKRLVGDEESYVSLAKRSVFINRPLHEVFEMVADPQNWPSFINGLESISKSGEGIFDRPGEFRWQYRIRGIRLSGKGEATEVRPYKKIVLQMESMMPIRKVIEFIPEGGGTILSVEVGYKNPGKVLSFLFNTIRRLLNVMETMSVLERIRSFCEEGISEMEERAGNQ